MIPDPDRPDLSEVTALQIQIDELKAKQSAILDGHLMKLDHHAAPDDLLQWWIDNLPDGFWKRQLTTKLTNNVFWKRQITSRSE